MKIQILFLSSLSAIKPRFLKIWPQFTPSAALANTPGALGLNSTTSAFAKNSHPFPLGLVMPSSFPCCSVAQLCLTLCDPMDCSMPGLSVPHQLAKFAQVPVHCIHDAIQSSHPLTPSSSALTLSPHQDLFSIPQFKCHFLQEAFLKFPLDPHYTVGSFHQSTYSFI